MSEGERRVCERFEIPGASLVCRFDRKIFKRRDFSEDVFPVLDISFGGVRFLSQRRFQMSAAVTVKISLPEQKDPLIFQGRVVRESPHPGRSYDYQIGVQFSAYGVRRGCNPPENLARLKAIQKDPSRSGTENIH